jgi:hypothetical protein
MKYLLCQRQNQQFISFLFGYSLSHYAGAGLPQWQSVNDYPLENKRIMSILTAVANPPGMTAVFVVNDR